MTAQGDELLPILFTRLLGAVIASVLTELAVFALARLYAGEGGYLTAFGGSSEDPFALGVALGAGLAIGIGLGAADHARARHGPRAALVVGVAALPLLAALTLYGATFVRTGSRDQGLQLSLDVLGKPDTWLLVGLAGLFALPIHGAFLIARARGRSPAEQSFSMVLAATVALVALAPATLFTFFSGPPERQGLVLLFLLARAPILPHAANLGDAVATALRRRMVGLSPWRATAGRSPRAIVRACVASVRAAAADEPARAVGRRVACGVEGSGEVLAVAWRLLVVAALVVALVALVGLDPAFRWVADLLTPPRGNRYWTVWSAYGATLFLSLLLLAFLSPSLSPTSSHVSARRALLAATVVLTAAVLALPERGPLRAWSTDPWGSLFLSGGLALVCARVVPGAVVLASAGAYVSVSGLARHMDVLPPAETWPYGLPLTPGWWTGFAVTCALVGLCGVLAGAALSGGRQRLVSALFAGVGALGAGTAALLLVVDDLCADYYWVEGAFVPVFPFALAGGVAGALAARFGRVARAALVLAALLLPVAAHRAIAATTAPCDLSTKLALARASRGDSAAMLEVAQRYEAGRGVVRTSQEAGAWYARAADAGSLDAMHRLGCRFAAGRGERRDVVVAREWLTRAAMAGHVRAADRLATLADEGR
jgi:hypothetical protein